MYGNDALGVDESAVRAELRQVNRATTGWSLSPFGKGC